jgi:hypothetical protein
VKAIRPFTGKPTADPTGNALTLPVPLVDSEQGPAVAPETPSSRIWVITHLLVWHTGDLDQEDGWLSFGFGPHDQITNTTVWNLAKWEARGFYRVGPFAARKVDAYSIPLRLPLLPGEQLAAAQTDDPDGAGTGASPLTILVTGTERP